jgi:hypothetical protein
MYRLNKEQTRGQRYYLYLLVLSNEAKKKMRVGQDLNESKLKRSENIKN